MSVFTDMRRTYHIQWRLAGDKKRLIPRAAYGDTYPQLFLLTRQQQQQRQRQRSSIYHSRISYGLWIIWACYFILDRHPPVNSALSAHFVSALDGATEASNALTTGNFIRIDAYAPRRLQSQWPRASEAECQRKEKWWYTGRRAGHRARTSGVDATCDLRPGNLCVFVCAFVFQRHVFLVT